MFSVLDLTQCGKRFESIVRQLADAIATAAIDQSKTIYLIEKDKVSLEDLIETMRAGGAVGQNSVSKALKVPRWRFHMMALWDIFGNTCPAGLARQMQVRIASDVLLFIVHQVANWKCETNHELNKVV